MTKRENRIQSALTAVLDCVCVLADQANNYSSHLNTKIFEAGEKIREISCSHPRRKRNRRK